MSEDNGKVKQPRKEKRVSMLDRLIQETIGQDRRVGLADDPAATQWPLVWEWLTRSDADRSHVMQPGRLSVTMTPTGCSASIMLPDIGYIVEANAANLAGVFDALELELASDNPNIRILGKREPKIRKRKHAN